MASTQIKLQPSDLATQIGQKVIVRKNSDNSEIKGIVLAYDSIKQAVQIDINKSHQWVSTAANSGLYIFKEQLS
jgi:hypothetical protein